MKFCKPTLQIRHWTSRLGGCLMAVVVASCGGDGTQTAGGGTGGTGISAGSVTAFGSIFVNGVEFNTNGATYSRDDVTFTRTPGQLDSDVLKIGMNVEVQGSITGGNAGVAKVVKVQENVRGAVEAISGSASAGTLVILDQAIQIDGTTKFDPASNPVLNFGSIAVADMLEVHGTPRADGSILASYIERKSTANDFSVRGIVSSHDAISGTFAIASPNGSLNVNYAAAGISEMTAPSGSNWNGLVVQVKGGSCTGIIPDCGTLNASLVRPGGLSLSNASAAEVEGFVTTMLSGSDFTVNSQRVITTPSTLYVGGLAADILTGVSLEAEGSLDQGVLIAKKIVFEDGVLLQSNATVNGSIITLEGLPGIAVTTNAFTNFNGTTATALNLAPLNTHGVRIRGHVVTGTNSVIATLIQAGSSTSRAILQGPVAPADVSNTSFKILGLAIDTTSLDNNLDFKDISGNLISRDGFFGALTAKGGTVMSAGDLPAPSGNAFDTNGLSMVQLLSD